MLAPLRQVARRSFLTFARPVSTVPPHPLNNVPSTSPIAPSLAPGSSVAVLAPQSPAPPTPQPRPGQPILLDIPPVEDPLLQYLTNSIMRHGNRKQAARIVSRTLLWIHAFTRAPPLPVLREAILSAAPAVRSVTHKHGGKSVSRPVALSERQRTRYAVKWILDQSKQGKTGQTLEERLAREVIAVLQGSSSVHETKKRIHDFAMLNRGNAELRV